jgi:SAM-dependent methyltransferase
MGLYSKYIFPRIVDWTLGRKEIGELRHELLAEVQGEVLEIGFGTGLNLPHYPQGIKKITTVDPNPGMQVLAQRRAQKLPIQIENYLLKGEALPFSDQHFDTVVSTFTLCSIPEVERALKEIFRVLKSGGRFLFLEHGLADRQNIQRWQRRLNPLQKKIGDGCQLDRNMEGLIETAGFKIVKEKKFYFPKVPKIVGYFYQGMAQKSKPSL